MIHHQSIREKLLDKQDYKTMFPPGLWKRIAIFGAGVVLVSVAYIINTLEPGSAVAYIFAVSGAIICIVGVMLGIKFFWDLN